MPVLNRVGTVFKDFPVSDLLLIDCRLRRAVIVFITEVVNAGVLPRGRRRRVRRKLIARRASELRNGVVARRQADRVSAQTEA